MKWSAVPCGVDSSPEILDFSRRLGRNDGLIYWLRVWNWCGAHDSVSGRVPLLEFKRLSGWRGSSSLLTSAFCLSGLGGFDAPDIVLSWWIGLNGRRISRVLSSRSGV